MSEYTEVPWEVAPIGFQNLVIKNDKYHICYVNWVDENLGEMQKANAQLMATAPELLERLEQASSLIERMICNNPEYSSNDLPLLNDIKKTIAKAKGDKDE